MRAAMALRDTTQRYLANNAQITNRGYFNRVDEFSQAVNGLALSHTAEDSYAGLRSQVQQLVPREDMMDVLLNIRAQGVNKTNFAWTVDMNLDPIKVQREFPYKHHRDRADYIWLTTNMPALVVASLLRHPDIDLKTNLIDPKADVRYLSRRDLNPKPTIEQTAPNTTLSSANTQAKNDRALH